MLQDKILNYISWLSERGLETPRLFVMPEGQEASLELIPQVADQNLDTQPAPIAAQNLDTQPAPTPDQSLEASSTFADLNLESQTGSPNSVPRDTKHEAPVLPAAETYIIAKSLPESASLQTLTKLIRALRLKDGEFVFHVMTSNPDPGTLLDQLESAACQRLIILDEQLSELILDADFHDVCQAPQETAYDIQIMAAPSLARLDPRAKAIFWKGLQQLFKLS